MVGAWWCMVCNIDVFMSLSGWLIPSPLYLLCSLVDSVFCVVYQSLFFLPPLVLGTYGVCVCASSCAKEKDTWKTHRIRRPGVHTKNNIAEAAVVFEQVGKKNLAGFRKSNKIPTSSFQTGRSFVSPVLIVILRGLDLAHQASVIDRKLYTYWREGNIGLLYGEAVYAIRFWKAKAS